MSQNNIEQKPITDLFSVLISKSISNGFTDLYITHCLNIIEEKYCNIQKYNLQKYNLQKHNYETLILNSIQSMNIDDFYSALALAYMNDQIEPEDTLLFIVSFS